MNFVSSSEIFQGRLEESATPLAVKTHMSKVHPWSTPSFIAIGPFTPDRA